MSNFWTTIFWTIFGTLSAFPLRGIFYSDWPWDSRFVFRESMWWAVHTLIAIWIKNDGDFRWFLLLWCSWHLNPSCIRERDKYYWANKQELQLECYLIKCFLQWKHEIKKNTKKGTHITWQFMFISVGHVYQMI